MSKPVAKHNSSGPCHYCQRMTYPSGTAEVRIDPLCMATRDHVNPQRLKGYVPDDMTARTVLCCHGCNAIKAQHPYQVFLFWRRHTPLELPQAHAAKEFQNFVYALALSGFKTCKALAHVERKKNQPTMAGITASVTTGNSAARRVEALL